MDLQRSESEGGLGLFPGGRKGSTSLAELLHGSGNRGTEKTWPEQRESWRAWGASCLMREQLDFSMPPAASNIAEVPPLLERSALGGREVQPQPVGLSADTRRTMCLKG